MWPRLIRSRLIADAFGAPALRDQGPIGRPGTARPGCKPRPTDLLLAKPDGAGSPPGQTTNGAGHGGRGIVRGWPLATARVRCEWHGSGTADEDGGGDSRRRHQVDRRVRPVPETPDLLARAAGPRQPSGGANPPSDSPVAQLVAVKVRRTAGGPGSSSSPVSEGGLRTVVIGLRRRRQVPTAPRRACWRIDPASCSSSTERL